MSYDSTTENFITAVQDNFLSQHIEFPTLVSGTQPDVVLSSCTDLVLDVVEMPPLGKSDHSMAMITLAGDLPSNITFEKVPDWRNANLEKLRQELDVDWRNRLEGHDARSSWIIFKDSIHNAERNCVPLKRRRTSSRPLWMQQSIMRVIRKKRRLWTTYSKTRDHEEYLAFKRVQTETQRLVRKAKRKFERKLAREAKRKPKLFYSYLN